MRISDWSSDVCSSDLTHRVPRSCGAVPEGHVVRRIALGASRGTWRKLQEHLLQVWRHQRFADRLEAVLPAPELDACIVARSEEHTSELQSLMRTSYAVLCLKIRKHNTDTRHNPHPTVCSIIACC